MTIQEAVAPTSDSAPGSLEATAKVVASILRSQEPEEELLAAIEGGTLPDQVGLELAEVFGEIVRVTNLDNSVELVTALSESGSISTLTQQALFLAIIEMAEQEEARQTETGDELAEVLLVKVPVSTPEPSRRDTLIVAATGLQQKFGTASAVPADKVEEVQRQVENLSTEEFASLRQFLSSVILAQAELPASERQVDVTATLEVVEIILRHRQRELTSAIFVAYETLHKQGFRLRDRDEANRPLSTIKSATLIRNRFRVWLDAHEGGLGEIELATAENAVRTLEGFLLAAAHESVQEAIHEDLAARLRERIIKSRVQALDVLASELVTALPQTKEEATRQVQGYHNAQLANLGSSLSAVGSRSLTEAEGTLGEILTGFSLCGGWRQDLATLESSDYNPADQQPSLSPAEKRLALFEVEHKELDQLLLEIEEEIKRVTESHGSGASLKKLGILRGITLRKIADLDNLITPLRPQPTRISTDGANGIPLPPLPFSTTNFPPPPSVTAPAIKEVNHG